MRADKERRQEGSDTWRLRIKYKSTTRMDLSMKKTKMGRRKVKWKRIEKLIIQSN